MKLKKAVEAETIHPNTVEIIGKQAQDSKEAFNRGVAGSTRPEYKFRFISTPSEKVLEGRQDASIVLGKDRPSHRLSGYGGLGDTGCSSVDIVVGRQAVVKGNIDQHAEIWVDPDFKTDAARIYVSQKTNIDENFGLKEGAHGITDAKSAIALKADGIRLIAREGIKLVTGTDGVNSQGGDIKSLSGIDLMAGNNDQGLQPIPKGENLIKLLEKVLLYIQDLNALTFNLLKTQMEFNGKLASHTHPMPPQPVMSPLGGTIGLTAPLPTMLSIPVAIGGAKAIAAHTVGPVVALQKQRTNLIMCKANHLLPSGDDYINSRHNNTN